MFFQDFFETFSDVFVHWDVSLIYSGKIYQIYQLEQLFRSS